MPKFSFYVTETREYSMLYEVEADTLAEAIEKAEIGDTVSEEELGGGGVSDRMVHGEEV